MPTFAFGGDWFDTYYPAVMLLLGGHNPYQITTLQNPPWTLIPLIPFALLGPQLGLRAYAVFILFTYGFVGYKLQARPLALVAFLLSPPILYSLQVANVDAVAFWGFILPPPIGLFFVLAKPQVGIGLAVFWAYTLWKDGGIRRVAYAFLPVTIALAAAFLVFGNWLAGRTPPLLEADWNASLFPWSLPAGFMLLYLGLKYVKKRAAIAASPFLSPYLGFETYGSVLVGLLGNPLIMIAVVVLMWLAIAVVKFRPF